MAEPRFEIVTGAAGEGRPARRRHHQPRCGALPVDGRDHLRRLHQGRGAGRPHGADALRRGDESARWVRVSGSESGRSGGGAAGRSGTGGKEARMDCQGHHPDRAVPRAATTTRPLTLWHADLGRFLLPTPTAGDGTFAEDAARVWRPRFARQRRRHRADAVATYLALALDKAVNYNSLMACWHRTRQVVCAAFSTGTTSLSSGAYAEFDAAGKSAALGSGSGCRRLPRVGRTGRSCATDSCGWKRSTASRTDLTISSRLGHESVGTSPMAASTTSLLTRPTTTTSSTPSCPTSSTSGSSAASGICSPSSSATS